MNRVRDLVAAGGVDVVLAQDADRITREPGDRSVLDLEAERRSCRWVALDDWGDDSHSERVKGLRLMQRNPILMFVGQTEDMRRDYYKDLELTVEVDKGDVKICGVFGSHTVAPTSTSGTRR